MRYADLLLAILEAAQARCSNQLKPI